MIKKIFTTAVMAVMFAFTTNAQKQVMYAGTFNKTGNMSNEYALQVRASIIAGLVDTQRFELIDIDASNILDVESGRRQLEAAMADAEARNKVMVEKAAQLLVYGDIKSCEATKSVSDDGSVSYSAEIAYTIKVVEAATKSTVASKDFSYGGIAKMAIGSTADEAITNGLSYVKSDMKKFVDENFKINGIIEPGDYELNKKGNKMKTCYINLGSDNGIKKGQLFDVQKTEIVLGRESTDIIGSLKVVEVTAGDLSKCEVEADGDKILEAMNEYLDIRDSDPDNAKPLKVVTKAKKIDIINIGIGFVKGTGLY